MSQQTSGIRAGLFDSLQSIFPDSPVQDGRAEMSLDIARGGTVAAHVLIDGLGEGREVELSVRENGKEASAVQWFRLIDVPVEVNTGPVGFELKEGETNEFVTRRAPFRVYDAMEPVGPRLAAAGPVLALRLHLSIGADEPAGKRTWTIEVRSGETGRELVLSAHVHKAILPPAGEQSFPYTNWYNFDHMAKRHGLEPWSEGHFQMIARYAQLMHHARQNTFVIWWPAIFTRQSDGLVLNRERLRRLVKIFTDTGLYWIEGGHVASRTGHAWESPTFSIALDGPLATSFEGNADLAKACRQLMEEIDANGWRKRWIQHVTDEPTSVNATDYRLLAGMVRKHMPGLPILDATMNTEVAGSVDIWCPQAQKFQPARETFENLKKLGDRVWFYTCCFPGGPWLNRLLDMELLRPALFGWGAIRFDLQGFLHWGLNWYKDDQDPFKQNVVRHGERNCLPAGDTHIVYPGKDGPWSSLRLEAQREGFEDYELLKILKQRDPQRADQIVAQVLRGFDDYTKDTQVFRAARRALLEAFD